MTTISDVSEVDYLRDELKSIPEAASNIQEEALLLSDLAFNRLVLNNDRHYIAGEYTFVPGKHGKLFRLPDNKEQIITELPRNYMHGTSIGDNFKLKPSFITKGLITPEGRQLLYVDQQAMVEVDKGKGHILTTNLTSCTALLAETEESLIYAHVGRSELGNALQVIEMLKSRGVSSSIIVAIVADDGSSEGVGWHQMLREDNLLQLGLTEENIHKYEVSFIPPNRDNIHIFNNVVQVTATDAYVAVRTFDYSRMGIGSIKPLFHNDLKVIPFIKAEDSIYEDV